MNIIQKDEVQDETKSLTESQQPPITTTTVATEFRQPPTTTTIALLATSSGIDNVTTTAVTEFRQPPTTTTAVPAAMDTVTTTAITGSLAQSTNHSQRELFQQGQSSTREEEVKPRTPEPVAVINRAGPSGSDNQHPLNHTSCEPTRPKEEQANQYNVHVSQAMNTQNASDRNPAQIIVRNPDMHKALTESQQPPITTTTVATEFRQPPTTTTTAIPATSSGIDTATTTVVTGSVAQSTNHTQRELFQQGKSSTREEEVKPQTQEPVAVVNRVEPFGSDNQQPLNHTSCEPTTPKEEQANQYNVHVSQAMNTQNASNRNPAQILVHNPDMRKASSDQQAAAEQAVNQPSGRQLPFARLLLHVLEPQLEKDRAMQLQALDARLMSNSINKEEFVQTLRTLVGNHMLKMACKKIQQGQVPVARQNTQRASSSLQSSDASVLPADQRLRLLEGQSYPHGGQASHASDANISAINHQQQQLQQQRMNLPQPSFPTHGNPGGNFHPSASANMGMPASSYKQQNHDLQMRQGPVNPAMAPQAMSQHALNDVKRLHGEGQAHFTSNPSLKQKSSHWQASMHKDQMNDQQHRSHLPTPHGLEHVTGGPASSKDDTFEAMSSRCGSITTQPERQNAAAVVAANSSLASGVNANTTPKKPIVGQKKPLEAPVNPLSKKQKVVGAIADQSIEQLSDVTADGGVNVRIPVRQYAQCASSSLQSHASTLPADQRPRLLERQSGSHGVKAIHVPNANVNAAGRQRQQQQQQLQLQQPQQHVNFPHSSSPTYSAFYTLQITEDTDGSHHYHHHHHHHYYHHHLMDPSQNIASNIDNVLQRTHIMICNHQGADATNIPSGKQDGHL